MLLESDFNTFLLWK